MASSYVNGAKTFTADGTIAQYRAVKLDTTTNEVIYTGAGEMPIGFAETSVLTGQKVAIRLLSTCGTHLCIADGVTAWGAVLYAAANGKVSDTVSGSPIGMALSAATADGDQIEAVMFPQVTATAAGTSIVDTGSFTAQTTVEAALQELYQDRITAQGFIDIPLSDLKIAVNFNVLGEAVGSGALGSNTEPVLTAINAATDGCQRVLWIATGVEQIIFQRTLPPDFDDTADVKLYTRIASGGTTNAVGFTVDSFWNEGDTKVVDTSATNQTTSYVNALTTIATADVPAATTLTVGLTPVAHGTDTMALTAVYILYKKKLLTS